MSKSDYDVGYGKPPKHTQFKKGQSGNPKGRRKGARGLKTDLREELMEMLTINENGKTTKLTKQRLMIKQLFAKASKGDVRAAIKMLEMANALLGPEQEASDAEQELAPEDAEIIREALEMLRK